jgi:hypothetical protein
MWTTAMTNRLALKAFVACFQTIPNEDRRLLILGSREIAGAEDLPAEMRLLAKAQIDPSLVSRPHSPGAVLGHASLKLFYDIGDAQDCPSPWIAGISTFYPQKNAMNGQFGSEIDRAYIRANRMRRAILATSAQELIQENPRACWMTDIEGADFEVGRQILLHGKCRLLLIEHALLSQEERIILHALGAALEYTVYRDSEDMCFAQGSVAP